MTKKTSKLELHKETVRCLGGAAPQPATAMAAESRPARCVTDYYTCDPSYAC
jgi:hypothetical protein